MVDPNQRGVSYTYGFFMLIGLTLTGLVIAGSLNYFVTNSTNSNTIKIAQCIQTIIGFFLPALLAAKILNPQPAKLLGFTGPISRRQVILVMAIVFSALFVSGLLSYLNDLIPISNSLKLRFEEMEENYNRQIRAIIGLNSAGEYLLAMVVIAFIPALCEETLFRGGLQNFLTRATKLPLLSIIIVSILFSAVHLSFYGFLSRFFLGMVLGLIYHYSGRLWLCVLAHFFNNAIALTVLYVYKLNGKPLEESMDQGSSASIGIVAIPVFIGLMYIFYRISIQPKEPKTFSFEEKNENLSHGT